MKSALLKDTLRELWRTKARFISIFTIIALGVGFFAGLKATSPYMLSTADAYYRESNLFDIHLVSTIGFNDDDIYAVKNSSKVLEVMPAYTLDTLVEVDGSSAVVKVHSLPSTHAKNAAQEMNRPTLLEGRLPTAANECVIDAHMKGELGEGLTFFADATQNELSKHLNNASYTIVGKVRTPYYITFERGSSTIGNGTINSFVMVPEENFVTEAYTDLYVNSVGKALISSFSEEYEALISELTTTLEATGDTRTTERHDEILDEANTKINEAEAELADGIATQQKELADARKKIDDGKQELIDGEVTLKQKEQEYLDEIAKGEQKLIDGEKKIKDAEIELADAKIELEDGKKELAEGIEDFRYGYEVYRKEKKEALEILTGSQKQLDTLRDNIPQILQAAEAYQLLGNVLEVLGSGTPSGEQLNTAASMLAGIPQLEKLSESLAGLATLVDAGMPIPPNALRELTGGIKQAQGQLTAQAGGKLNLAEVSAESLNSTLASGEGAIEQGYEQLAEGTKQINDAQKELEKAKEELSEGEQKYEDGERDSNKEIADARVKIDDAKKDLADFKTPKWYVQDRDTLPGWSGYGEDAERIDAIARVFPVFFLLVAVLVCLTTMTRMVEEKRTQIGTLKALGYSNFSISSSFLSYALVAAIAGSAAGLVVGFQLFPRIIYNAYGIMYTMPPLVSPFKWDYAIIATIVVVIITSVTVLFASYKELTAVPAELMRPKAPKNGKRVFLERLPFLWNKLSFTHKVTMRNLLRYKKRMLMTVIGIAGCAALIVTGFGVKDSISSIVTKQFNEIFKYDVLAVLEADLPPTEKDEVQAAITQSTYAKSSILLMQKSYTAKLGNEKVDGYLFLPSDIADTESFIVLRERKGGKPLTLNDDGVIISEKTSELLAAGVGDTITLSEKEGEEFDVKIASITENYAGHYFYLTPTLYERLTGTLPNYNALLATMNSPTKENRDAFSKQLLATDKIIVTSFTEATKETFTGVMQSLNYVVLVLILSAGALAFVVLYNLTNINIAERVREIATIKVLGFYDKEVSAYIYRENILLTFIGMLAGLGLGVLLHRFVISTAEVQMVMFGREIAPISFVLSGGITIIFALIVNLVMFYKLKKISMVESLKSVE